MTSTVNANHTANHVFFASTFTTTDSLGGSNSGTYTFTRFTPEAALVVETYTGPPGMIGTTNYLILFYTNTPSLALSPVTGAYFSENVNASGEVSSDVGNFSENTFGLVSGVLPAVPPLHYVGPATLSGLQATVTPKGERSFIRSYGDGTFASTSLVTNEPTDVGIILANTRVSANTEISTFLALNPPYAVGQDDDTVDVTWQSAIRATVTVVGANETASLAFSKAGNYAPPALTGHRITATPAKNGKTSVLSFTNNLFTAAGGLGESGTYTYARYTPTMALVLSTSIDVANAEEVDYFLLNYQSPNAGTYVLSKPVPGSAGSWTFTTGVFSTK
ncbi:MAG TPA: hypothetical protein VFC44_12295 [Candidatus Saccharimonadales bacterium]|nr:hypothetical protein [Candidatus Saccharimonadales bacterium]